MLPNDIARCDGRISQAVSGYGTVLVGQSECVRCARRTAPRPEQFWLSAPPEFLDGKCPDRIAEQPA